MRSRLVPFVALFSLAFLPAVGRPDDAKSDKKASPALVVQIRSFDGVMGDLRYLAAQVGKEEEARQGEELLKERIGQNGLDGIDVKKPMGLYLIAGPDGTDSYGAFLLPVKNEKAVLDLLSNTLGVEPEKSKDGIYTVKHEKLPVPVFFRFANGYAYITAVNQSGLAKDKMLAPGDVLTESDPALISATVRIDQVPDKIKEVGIMYLSLAAAQAREDKLEGQTKAQKDLAEQATKESTNQARSLLNDGRELSIKVDVDRAKNDLSIVFSLNSKPGTKLATSITELGQAKSLFAGQIGKDSAISFLFNYALSDRLKKSLGPVIDEGIKKALEESKDETHKAASEKLLKVLTPSLKAGEIDAAVELRGPSAKKHYTLVFGIKLKDGKAVEQAVKDIVKDLPPQQRDLVKIDAQKAQDVNIHEVDIDHALDDKAREVFGNEPLYFAVRANALYVALGEGSLNALKQSLAAKPGAAGMLRFDLSMARLAPLMASEQPDAPKAAEEAFGKDPNSDKLQIRVTGGDSLKTEIHVKPAVLKFLAIVGEASKRNTEK
jgi:hypothetical protein